jgi:hypothetical protein
VTRSCSARLSRATVMMSTLLRVDSITF